MKRILHDAGYVRQVIASGISWPVFVASRLLLASLPPSSHKMSSERAAVRFCIVCPPLMQKDGKETKEDGNVVNKHLGFCNARGKLKEIHKLLTFWMKAHYYCMCSLVLLVLMKMKSYC